MVANNYNGLLRYEGSRNYQASRSGRKLSRRLLGQLENRMNIFGQKFGKFYTTLEDGSTIEVLIDNRSGIPFYQATLVPFIPEDVIVTTEESGLWICWPTADEAVYGWGDPYTEANSPLGSIRTSFALDAKIGRLMNIDGSVQTHGSSLIATPNNWRDPSTNVVISWTTSAIYANGIKLVNGSNIKCAALKTMIKASVNTLYLIWFDGSTLNAQEASIGTDLVTVNMVSATPNNSWSATGTNIASGKYWSFSQNATKVCYNYQSVTSCTPNQWTLCTHNSNCYEATTLPSDIADSLTVSFSSALQNEAISFAGSQTYSKKFLLKGEYVSSSLVGFWCEVGRSITSVLVKATPIDLSITAPAIYYEYFCDASGLYELYSETEGEIHGIIEETKTTTQRLYFKLYNDTTEIIDETLASREQLIYTHKVTGIEYSGVSPSPTSRCGDPEIECGTLEGAGITSDEGCELVPPGSQSYSQTTCTENPMLFAKSWQSAEFNRAAYFTFGAATSVSSGLTNCPELTITPDAKCKIAGSLTYERDFGTDLGSPATFILETNSVSYQAEQFLNATMRDLCPPDDDTTAFGITGVFLNINPTALVHCVGGLNNLTSEWNWKSYLNNTELTAQIGIGSYTNPRIIYEASGEPIWSFGLLQQPST